MSTTQEIQEKIANDTELQKLLSEVNELLTEDQDLKEKQEEEERLSNEHMERAASIEKERKRINKYINIIRNMSAMTKAYAKMIEDAIDPQKLGEQLEKFRNSGQLQAGAHESIVQQFNLQEEEEPEEVPDETTPDSQQGVTPLAVGTG